MKNIIVKKKHSENCCIAGTPEEYYCFINDFFRNYCGNKTKIGCYHYWLEFICNDPSCKCEILVLNSFISNFLREGSLLKNNHGTS